MGHKSLDSTRWTLALPHANYVKRMSTSTSIHTFTHQLHRTHTVKGTQLPLHYLPCTHLPTPFSPHLALQLNYHQLNPHYHPFSTISMTTNNSTTVHKTRTASPHHDITPFTTKKIRTAIRIAKTPSTLHLSKDTHGIPTSTATISTTTS